MTKETLKNSGLLLASILVGIFLLEGILFILSFPKTVHSLAYRPNLDIKYKNFEFEYRHKTNDMGLRYRTIPLVKSQNSYRIFISGDSFVEGPGVAEEKTFCGLLEKSSSTSQTPVYFINGGKAGAGPLVFGRILYSIGFEYNPDAVLIFVFANDISNTRPDQHPRMLYEQPQPPQNFLAAVLPRLAVVYEKCTLKVGAAKPFGRTSFLDETEQIAKKRGIPQNKITAWKNAIPPELAKLATEEQVNTMLMSSGLLRPRYWSDGIDIDTKIAQGSWLAISNLLVDMIDQCRERDIRVGLVYMPCAFQFDPNAGSYKGRQVLSRTGLIVRKEWLTEETQIQNNLRTLAGQNRVAFLDLAPALRKKIAEGMTLTFAFDGHLNEDGHKAVADTLEYWLKNSEDFVFLQ
jgi:hypothetical protein